MEALPGLSADYEGSDQVMRELKAAFGTEKNSEVIRRSLALARVVAHYADNGELKFVAADGTAILVKLRS